MNQVRSTYYLLIDIREAVERLPWSKNRDWIKMRLRDAILELDEADSLPMTPEQVIRALKIRNEKPSATKIEELKKLSA